MTNSTEPNLPQKQSNRRAYLIATLLACLPAVPIFIAFIFDVISRQGDIPAPVALQMEAARRISNGELAYVDFWDWSQPLALEIASWPQSLKNILEVMHTFTRLEVVSKVLDLCLVLISFALSQALLLRQDSRIKVSLAVASAIALYTVRFQFGVNQEHFILCFVPYLALRWLRYGQGEGIDNQLFSTPRVVAYFVGLLAGLGICLDIVYWPLPLLVESLLLMQTGKFAGGKAQLAEFGGILSALLAAYISFAALTPMQRDYFLRWMMTLRWDSLLVFDQALIPLGNSPDRRDIIYLLSAAIIATAMLTRKNRLYMPICATALWGLLIYICEGTGLSEGLVVCSYSTTLLLVLTAFELLNLLKSTILLKFPKATAKPVIVSICLTVLMVPVAFFSFRHTGHAYDRALSVSAPKEGVRYPDVAQTLDKYTKWKDDVLLLAYSDHSIYPTLTNMERHQSGYLLSAQPLFLLTLLDQANLTDKNLKEFRTYLLQKLTADLSQGQAKLILVDSMREMETLERYKLVGKLEEKYDRVGVCRYYSECVEPTENNGLGLYLAIYHPRGEGNLPGVQQSAPVPASETVGGNE